MGNPYVAEIMVQAGFQWLVLDMEHSAANDLAQVQRLIQVIDLAGCAPLVRMPSNDPVMIKLVLDAGSHGVIVPMVNSREQAQAAVAAVRYPPGGQRGVGLWRAQGYGRDFDAYKEWLATDCRLFVQIEHHQAVENMEEILTVDGVDGFLVGPYDLSASLGLPGEFQQPRVRQALEEIDAVARETKKWAGYHVVHPDRAHFLDLIQRGYNLIAYGTDFTFLTSSVDAEMAYLQNRLQGKGDED